MNEKISVFLNLLSTLQDASTLQFSHQRKATECTDRTAHTQSNNSKKYPVTKNQTNMYAVKSLVYTRKTIAIIHKVETII
jgi:hypothetical protein